jgi:Protein of unknown function (DUF1549)/Protein of unknown function (DUF1553)
MRPHRLFRCRALVVSASAALSFCIPAFSHADELPLHIRIDQTISAGKPNFAKQASGPATDAEFLRRVYLDLTGTIPTAGEARTFLKDASPNKREALIDRLLASPECARHLANVFDVMLLERRPDKHVPHAPWHEYLRTAFADNKPWDQLVREILSADGVDPKQRPAAKFYLDRDGEPNVLVRDVSRLFLGMNFQCAQCHDHPRVEEYKQDYYYGLFAFLNRTFVFPDPALKMSVLAEKGDGEVTFQSVFDAAKVTKSAAPHILDLAAVKEPAVEKGKEYDVAPAPNVRPVPKFSRRAQLAGQITASENTAFKRNAANRFWAVLIGRGLIHPLDMDHPLNPPADAALFTLLADDFAARKYDVRGFLKEIALSQAYQRSSELPSGVKEADPTGLTMALLKPLSPEQLAFSLMQATGLTDVERSALGDKANEAALYAKLSPQVPAFVNAFASPPGKVQVYDPRLDQALFLANGKTVRGWLAPRAGNLTDRLNKIESADALADELYLNVFTRLPSTEEKKDVGDFLAKHPTDRTAAIQDLAWALLTSAEFRFNH